MSIARRCVSSRTIYPPDATVVEVVDDEVELPLATVVDVELVVDEVESPSVVQLPQAETDP